MLAGVFGQNVNNWLLHFCDLDAETETTCNAGMIVPINRR